MCTSACCKTCSSCTGATDAHPANERGTAEQTRRHVLRLHKQAAPRVPQQVAGVHGLRSQSQDWQAPLVKDVARVCAKRRPILPQSGQCAVANDADHCAGRLRRRWLCLALRRRCRGFCDCRAAACLPARQALRLCSTAEGAGKQGLLSHWQGGCTMQQSSCTMLGCACAVSTTYSTVW